MSRQYTVAVNANTGGTENAWLELLPGSGLSIAIKLIRASSASAVSDQILRIRVFRATTAGSGGVSYTPVKRKPSGPAATSTCQVKTGTTGFTAGTTTDKIADFAFNSRGAFEWIARDSYDLMWSNVDERLVLSILSSSTQASFDLEVDFVE